MTGPARPVRIRDQRPCHPDQIGVAGLQDALRERRVGDPLRGHHRQSGLVPHRPRQRDGDPGGCRHVLDVRAPRPDGDREVVHVARAGQLLRDGQAGRQVHPFLELLDPADPRADGEVVTAAGPDRLDDAQRETGPILQRATPLVLALVGGRREELRDQVAVRRVQLHPVEAGVLQVGRRDSETVDQLLDLVRRHGVRRLRGARAADGRRRPHRQVRLPDGLPPQVHQLAEDLGAVPMHARGQAGEARKVLAPVALAQRAGA